MHRLAALPGGWSNETEGVVFIEQSAAPLIVLTAADTDIQVLAAAARTLPSDFPELRVTNLLNLQQQLTIDTYAETVLRQAKAIVVRLLGGRAYWPYGLEVLKDLAAETGALLLVLPGDDKPDPDLVSHSTVSLEIMDRLWRYFTEGGIENAAHALQFLADQALGTQYQPPLPQALPRLGLYPWQPSESEVVEITGSAGLLFYRAHVLAGNTAVIDALCSALYQRGLQPVPVFVYSLRDPDFPEALLNYLKGIEVLLNTTSFSLAKLDGAQPDVDLWQRLNVPVLQVILSSSTTEAWLDSSQGLSPRDVAMNVALPEVDGRLITRAVSFKAVQTQNQQLETDVVVYEPLLDRIEFVADLTTSWARLRQTPPQQRRVSLVLANYPCRDGRLANGVGLDTPASCVQILQAMQQAGYSIYDLPSSSDELMALLTSRTTNDPEAQGLRPVVQSLPLADYKVFFLALPQAVQSRILERWGLPEQDPHLCQAAFPIAGLQLGSAFIGIQPPRGYELDPTLNYHAPDLVPPHAYLAFYVWLRQRFQAQAIVHVGKHGNLEWLPGKGVALSQDCFPEAILGPLPHLYPFIVNDPGEGSQAKRRSQAVIVDHLTPPLTRAELYGPLQALEHLIDEYYEARSLDPKRLKTLEARISQLIHDSHLHQDLGTDANCPLNEFLALADGYLCELKEAQIRDGLHIFGQCPQAQQLRDLIVALARSPQAGRLGLTQAIAEAYQLDFDPLTVDLGQVCVELPDALQAYLNRPCRITGDAVEALEHYATYLVEALLADNLHQVSDLGPVLPWLQKELLPALQQTTCEITNLLHGLAGGYVPSGPSGAPTRGRTDVLPTGRNFYSVDIRAIPTETAWALGRKAAEALIERYTQDHGEYPKTLGLSVWGTSTMRTGGDDIAQALALLGVQPLWDGPSRRVVDFEILPLTAIGRPRVDVTLRISGFFRDAFPNLISLFDSAVQAIAQLNEPPDQNPLAAQVQQDSQRWQQAGLDINQAQIRAQYRIFGSKPGAYGAGLQGLIEAQNWQNEQDLALAYLNWGGYAYTGSGNGTNAAEAFSHRLKALQIVLHNQDNREHDLVDSDDYYQFQGGMTAAVRALSGTQPATYFGDHSRPEKPQVRSLTEEMRRVYRSRVINPKWIAGVMRHGYKGAFEMAATVDYIFAYDATTNCVEDFMYQGIAEAYVLDPQVQSFIQQKNPWALRDIAERLIEAHSRNLWQEAPTETLKALRAISLEAEALIEQGLNS
ncbi:cobaltochelatase subunit CobN [Leptolyngbya sp. FACHB-261]|uniref:cobaltochelatase subunit CobN n=1 Tax=Leptolyngbya sp. FACHB-261 TaxID=2692806 RepID=UPI001687993C|nr:cobaltochelatase subunit CobN [Leptolyngbya sp. FACHB-261]MBD2099832.1 cobaltochelatase subunit CobN [Leptolyngbya sp. FACHB-261]